MWFIGVEVEQETSAPPPKKILDPPLMIMLLLMMMFLMMVFFSWQSRIKLAYPQQTSLTAITHLSSQPIK